MTLKKNIIEILSKPLFHKNDFYFCLNTDNPTHSNNYIA